MRFNWLLLSILSVFLFCSPAEAGRLLFWRFESNQNRLIFTTDQGVQPKAQLIPNPTRVVIDLPGVSLGRPNVNQPIGGTIRSVRVGQFDFQTTRIVVELAPGYTVDPQQVKIRGVSPTQWTVDLPTPERIEQSPSFNPRNNQSTQPTNLPQTETPPATSTTSQNNTGSSDFQITRNGLFVRLKDNKNKRIKISRSRDRSQITFDLDGATIPASLASQTLPVNAYQASSIQFSQTSTSPASAQILLTVSPDSPDWQAVYSRFGGLVLLPKNGINTGDRSNIPSYSPTPITSNPTPPKQATIQSLELSNNNRQLLIRSDQPIRATSNWNRTTGIYEIRIPNAQLAEPVRGPQLDRNSPIYQLRIRQEDAQTVVVLVRPSLGVQLGQLNQSNGQLLALDISSPRAAPLAPRPLTIPPPLNNSNLPPLSNPSNPPIPARNGRILVVIDPGHGGKDPGAIGIGGIYEKDIILPISQYLQSFLEQQGVQVMMTRNSDYFVSLQGRTDRANRARADLFVSIHANSMGKSRPDVSGLEVYYFGNRGLADTIHRSITRSVDVKDRGVRKARFYVLRNSSMPSTLVEVGFVTGYEDSSKLKNPSYQRQMAEAIARGILQYIQQNKR